MVSDARLRCLCQSTFLDDAAAGNSPPLHRYYVYRVHWTVKVDKHLIGKTVKVSNGMTLDSATVIRHGSTASLLHAPNLRFVVVIACDERTCFPAESFDASTLPGASLTQKLQRFSISPRSLRQGRRRDTAQTDAIAFTDPNVTRLDGSGTEAVTTVAAARKGCPVGNVAVAVQYAISQRRRIESRWQNESLLVKSNLASAEN